MLLSLISVGGMPSVLPELQRYVVDVKGWMSPEDFIQIFAVGQAAPGPNMLIASLVGWKVAGLAGALVALASMCGPAAVLAWWVAEAWERFKDSPWRIAAIQRDRAHRRGAHPLRRRHPRHARRARLAAVAHRRSDGHWNAHLEDQPAVVPRRGRRYRGISTLVNT